MRGSFGSALLIGSALALGGCVNGNEVQRTQVFNGLIGHPEADVVRTLGVPTRVYEADGRKFLAFDQRRFDVDPGFGYFGFGRPYGYGYGFGYGGFYDVPRVIVRGCETTFELSADRVQSWTDRGHACG